MKNSFIYLIAFSLFITACSKSPADELKAKIKENKDTIRELKKENTKLEKELKKLLAGADTLAHMIPVEIETINPAKFSHYIEVNGVLEAEESANITGEIPAQIKTIHVKDGQRVSKGQLLVTLNSETASNNLAETEASLELATTVFNRQKNLWDQNIGSEVEYLQAKSNKERLESVLAALKAQVDLYNIRAPFSGIVDNITGKEGELASPGAPILMLVNLYKMKIKTDVSEVYLPSIKTGDTAQVSFYTFPDKIIKCPIKRTGNIVHPDNRTFNVEISVDNSSEQLKPNMMARLLINDFSQENALIVPSAVIKKDIVGKFLFIEDDGIAKKVYVETGKSYMDKTVILNGLESGNNIIISGYNTVSNNAPVEVR